jgi:hypothetical protein
MGYVGMLATEGLANKWPIKFYFFGFVAALLPFGPIVFDKKVLDRL